MHTLETDRLLLRRLTEADAPFMRDLLNEPSFLRYIGDRGVRSVEDARRYIVDGPVRSYAVYGYGLLLVTRRADALPVGICGLLKRPSLDDPDLGFALRPSYWSQGYAHEAARGVLDYGRDVLALPRVAAITVPDNDASIRLLERLGLSFERMVTMPGDDTPLRLYARAL